MSHVPRAELVTALQLGDSAFPTGAFAYSWGMETLLADAQLQRRDLAGFVETELSGRWHGIDRPALAGGWRAETIADLEDCDLSLWSEAQRRASQEAGAATLAAATRLELASAREIRASVTAGRMAGHLPVLTGALHRGAGLGLTTALLVAAQGFLRGLLSAAVRLGQAGALEAQRIARALAPTLIDMARPPAPGTLPQGFSPMTDIALMRPHAARLFVN
ncbi:urease accessory protein UreF [Salipiger thiooxidans]|uniref:urease accessory protein UreF n=1 Tax=Salipiger thiooxidans TaxID=282683 RepID=UPI001CD6BF9E|nr:urease accessory UreF family protein [Salipiger thiooxidans]MCA0847419.1 urease accessory protein UreF [Salipiger thiooxidans]